MRSGNTPSTSRTNFDFAMEDEKGYAYLIGQVESVSVSEGETCKVIVLRPEKVDLKSKTALGQRMNEMRTK